MVHANQIIMQSEVILFLPDNNISNMEVKHTLQPLYDTVLDITRFKDGSQKCIEYIEK